MNAIDSGKYEHIVFFTGAGMSAESGVPTYRGRGGIWERYRWEEFACQEAFDADPEKVLKFHELRRAAVLACPPHAGHAAIAALEKRHPGVMVVTQNIDGMHQRAGSGCVLELHGSLWRLRCPHHGLSEDIGEKYRSYRCEKCGSWLRPDITWFGDALDGEVVREAVAAIRGCDLFVSVGTSGVGLSGGGVSAIRQREQRSLRRDQSRGERDVIPLRRSDPGQGGKGTAGTLWLKKRAV